MNKTKTGRCKSSRFVVTRVWGIRFRALAPRKSAFLSDRPPLAHAAVKLAATFCSLLLIFYSKVREFCFFNPVFNDIHPTSNTLR